MSVFIPPRELRALATAGAAMLMGTVILQQFPALELSLFAAGAARLTGFLTGMPVGRIAEGWLLTSSSSVIAVTAACSATDYYLMVVALLTWQRVRQGQTAFAALLVGFFAALPLTVPVPVPHGLAEVHSAGLKAVGVSRVCWRGPDLCLSHVVRQGQGG